MTWDPGVMPNSVTIAAVIVASARGQDSSNGSRTELDSHANMPVVGRNVAVIAYTGRDADVSAFSPDYKPMKIKIVDAAMQYDCEYTNESYLLVIRNALHVPSMEHNLMPPFIMREAGISVHDIPKIQINDPSVNDHCIVFPNMSFRIPLKLTGVFSYFNTRKPTDDELENTSEVYVLTPEKWNPNNEAYAMNEGNMLDWRGNIVEKKHRSTILLSEIEDDVGMAASLQISSVESSHVDTTFDTRSILQDEEISQDQPCCQDKMSLFTGHLRYMLLLWKTQQQASTRVLLEQLWYVGNDATSSMTQTIGTT